VLCFLHYSWNATKTFQHTANSRTKKTGDSSEAFDGRGGCGERSQRSSDCSGAALQVRMKVTPKSVKRMTPATVRLIVRRYSDKAHPSNSKAN